jgi:wyosine [tRNA(Phe)-imidazoG37] synthetase (radical SAM superfamily)
MPTLDAGTERLYLQLNRPQPGFSFERLVDGLVAFGEEYEGRYWVEVMLVKGRNDTEEALRDIAAVLRRIRATEIHVNLPVRPPAEPWVQPPDADGLRRAVAILGDVAHVVAPTAASIDLGGYDDVLEAVLHILQCHPLRDDELREALALRDPATVDETIDRLMESGRAQLVTRDGGLYWCHEVSQYGKHRSLPG